MTICMLRCTCKSWAMAYTRERICWRVYPADYVWTHGVCCLLVLPLHCCAYWQACRWEWEATRTGRPGRGRRSRWRLSEDCLAGRSSSSTATRWGASAAGDTRAVPHWALLRNVELLTLVLQFKQCADKKCGQKTIQVENHTLLVSENRVMASIDDWMENLVLLFRRPMEPSGRFRY